MGVPGGVRMNRKHERGYRGPQNPYQQPRTGLRLLPPDDSPGQAVADDVRPEEAADLRGRSLVYFLCSRDQKGWGVFG